ncbi:flagellar biosynthetic protein FliO [Liquorilactobacillus uvarum]|uniref:flagellar biosynthetic protein FliO n=1 Tax=Liquorilactobacillus uvarum TaxID=303240 RepID=UPI002889339A|nr:flagellar biosynthetic protein FliO [Liquorilactobacillus uvarum]
MDIFFSLIKISVFLLIIIYLINVSLKYLNKYTNQTNSTFRILRKIAVSKTSSIGIVQIIDKYYVMSFSEQKNEILKELTEEEAGKFLASIEQVSRSKNAPEFSDILRKVTKKLSNKKGSSK